MSAAAELEALIRRLVREEVARALAGEEAPANDDAAIVELAQARAAKLKRARGGR